MSEHPFFNFIQNLFENHDGEIPTDFTPEDLIEAIQHSGIDISNADPETLRHTFEQLMHHSSGTGGNHHNEINFTGSDKQYWLEQAAYEKKEADNAYFWYKSYLKDGNLSKADSYLKDFNNHKENAERYLNKAKWAKS